MSVTLAVLDSVYWCMNKKQNFSYESPLSRSPCDKIQLLDSTVFLPSTVLPGIPVVALEKKQWNVEHFINVAMHVRRIFEFEYKWSPWQEKYLFRYMMDRRIRNQYVLDNVLNNPILFALRAKTPSSFQLKLHFDQTEIRPDVSGLDCRVSFQLQNSCVKVKDIFLNDPLSQSRDRPYKKAVILCAAFTMITFRFHLLNSHLLSVQTIYSYGAKSLPNDHLLYALIHPHGYQVCPLDLRKVPALAKEQLTKDWSFTPQGASSLFCKWQKTFSLNKLSFPHWSKRFKNCNMEQISPLYTLLKAAWTTIHFYVNAWIHRMYLNTRALQKDLSVQQFWKCLTSCSHKLVCNQTLTRKNLVQLVATFIYVSVVVHHYVGKEMEETSKETFLFVPRDLTDHKITKKLFLSEQYFQLVKQEATRQAYPLREMEWIHCMPESFQDLALDFQKKMIALNSDFYLGINV
jgi:hypothetical protein